MTLTLNEIQAVVPELDRVLAGGRLTGAYLEDDETIVVTVRQGSVDHRVLICARFHQARLHLTSHESGIGHERRTPREGLADFLHNSAGSLVEEVRLMYHDRVVAIKMLGDGEGFTLLFECTGHHPNVFALDSRGVIRAMLRRSLSSKRDLRPGMPYVRPIRRPPDPFESIRFLGDGAGISADIEAHYDGMVTGRPSRWVSVTPPPRRGRKRK